MSYCRFSSDDGKSDVYVYRSVEGNYHINVIKTRIIEEGAAQTRRYETVTLPHAGEEFQHESPDATFRELNGLRELGYHVPQAALDRLASEMSSA